MKTLADVGVTYHEATTQKYYPPELRLPIEYADWRLVEGDLTRVGSEIYVNTGTVPVPLGDIGDEVALLLPPDTAPAVDSADTAAGVCTARTIDRAGHTEPDPVVWEGNKLVHGKIDLNRGQIARNCERMERLEERVNEAVDQTMRVGRYAQRERKRLEAELRVERNRNDVRAWNSSDFNDRLELVEELVRDPWKHLAHADDVPLRASPNASMNWAYFAQRASRAESRAEALAEAVREAADCLGHSQATHAGHARSKLRAALSEFEKGGDDA